MRPLRTVFCRKIGSALFSAGPWDPHECAHAEPMLGAAVEPPFGLPFYITGGSIFWPPANYPPLSSSVART